MRLCITSGTFHPDVGGPPTYLAALADDLVSRGHKLRVVTYGHSSGHYRYRVTRIPRGLPAPVRLAQFGLTVGVEARQSDVLYVNDYGLPAAVANLMLRKPLIMKIVGDFAWEYAVRHGLIQKELGIDEFQQRRFGRRVERVRRLQSWYTCRADLVVVPSSYLAGIVRGWGVEPERLRVVPNAPPPDRTVRSQPRSKPRPKIGSAASLQVVTVARLAPWKGIDHLIEAVGLARQSPALLKLPVIGDGDDRARLERLAARLDNGAVHFAGQLPHETTLDLIAGADMVALCSSYEAFLTCCSKQWPPASQLSRPPSAETLS